MLTNEERREVAARLRNLAGHKAADEELTLDALGLYRGENIEGYDTYGVMQLADLIEPEPERTCKFIPFIEDDGSVFIENCSECDAAVLSRCEFNYCPNCGARVTEVVS